MRTATYVIIIVIILNLISIGLLSGFAFFTMVPKKLVYVKSGSMENGNRGSIDTGNYIKLVDVEDSSDVTTYVEGTENGYRKAGSYGDVIFFHPNGNKVRTAVIHRAVVWIEFNSTTYDPESGFGGGFDIPSMDLLNVLDSFTISNYEWPKRPESSDETIDVRAILNRFRVQGITPHSGYLTKGDDNDHVDQVSSFAGSEPEWIQVVKMNWIIGKFTSKVQTDPLNISCCVSWLILPITLGLGIYVLVIELKGRREQQPHHELVDGRRRVPVRRPQQTRPPPGRWR